MQGAVHAATSLLPHLRRGLGAGARRPAAPHLRMLTGAERGRARRHASGCWRSTARAPTTTARATRWRRSPARSATTACASSRGCTASDPAARCARRSSRRWSSATAASARSSRSTTAPAGCGSRRRAWSARPPRWCRRWSSCREMEAQGERLARAELRALRAQISPHFIYNALAAVASFIHSRPGGGARAADRVRRVHPLRVRAPARVRHGGRRAALRREVPAARAGALRRAADACACRSTPRCCRPCCRCSRSSRWWRTRCATGSSASPRAAWWRSRASTSATTSRCACPTTAPGSTPSAPRAALAGQGPGIGLGNVHGRLQSTFGEGYGLQVESDGGRGTTVVMTLPKFRAGVRAA